MTNNTSFLTRIPADLLAAIDDVAAQAGLSRNQLVVNVLAERFGHIDANPPLLVGWIAIDRPGEIEPWDCPECGQSMHKPHIGIMSNGVLTDVVCGSCAVTSHG